MYFRTTDVGFVGAPVWPAYAPSMVPLLEGTTDPGYRVTLRRWAALLALAGLALPGVRAESAAGAAQTVPAALAAAPALSGLALFGHADGPWESAVVDAPAPDAAEAAALAATAAALVDADGTPLPVAPPPGPVPVAAPAPAPPAPAPAPAPPASAPAPPAAVAAVAAPARSNLVPPEREYLRKVLIRHAQENGLPADLIMAQAWKESSWRARPVSHAGARGVMQLMPATVEFVSKNLLGLNHNLDPNNPTHNVRMGTRFMRHLVDRSGGNYRRALIAYNQGITSLRTKGAYREAEQYADKVLALRKEFKTP